MKRLITALALLAAALPGLAALPLPAQCSAVVGPANTAAVPLAVSGTSFAACSGAAIEIRTIAAIFGDWRDYTVAPDASLSVTARDSIRITAAVPPFATLTLNAPTVIIGDLSATGWQSLTVRSPQFFAAGSRIEVAAGSLVIDGIGAPAPVRFQGTQLSIVGDAVLLSTPVAAVPEPGTWAMLLAGVGFVGFVARRRLAGRYR